MAPPGLLPDDLGTEPEVVLPLRDAVDGVGNDFPSYAAPMCDLLRPTALSLILLHKLSGRWTRRG